MKKQAAHFALALVATFVLTACGLNSSQWNQEVTIPSAQRAEYEARIQELTYRIANYEATEEGESIFPPIYYYVDLGRAYEGLGNYKGAMKAYQDGAKANTQSQALDHNIGRLYEKVGLYKKAIAQYQMIVEKYDAKGYLYDITWAYIRDEDLEGAKKNYDEWKKSSKRTDLQTEQALVKLKDRLDGKE